MTAGCLLLFAWNAAAQSAKPVKLECESLITPLGWTLQSRGCPGRFRIHVQARGKLRIKFKLPRRQRSLLAAKLMCGTAAAWNRVTPRV